MRHLITQADVITPNLTELFYLLDKPYKAENSDEELKAYLHELSDKGPETVIITSIPVQGDPRKTSVYAYNRSSNRYWKVTCPYLPAHYPGTGDTFTSVITGSLMQGDSLPLPWIVPHNLFCKASVPHSVTNMTIGKVSYWKKCFIIWICPSKSAVTN